MSFKETLGNLFHHNKDGENKAEPADGVATNEATPAVHTAEVTTPETTVETTQTTPEVKSSIDDQVTAALGQHAGAFEEINKAIAEGNGDTVAPTEVPVSADVAVAEAHDELAALPTVEEPVAEVAETPAKTFQVTEVATAQEVVPAPEVAPQAEVPAPISGQEAVPATPEVPTVDAKEDATTDPESDKLWDEFKATAPTANAEVAPAPETPEQNQ